jgi:hypothetical protein
VADTWKTKIRPLQEEQELRSDGGPARSQSLYRLRYRGFFIPTLFWNAFNLSTNKYTDFSLCFRKAVRGELVSGRQWFETRQSESRTRISSMPRDVIERLQTRRHKPVPFASTKWTRKCCHLVRNASQAVWRHVCDVMYKYTFSIIGSQCLALVTVRTAQARVTSQRIKKDLYSLWKLQSVAWVRERTIPTERPPLVGEVSANFCA